MIAILLISAIGISFVQVNLPSRISKLAESRDLMRISADAEQKFEYVPGEVIVKFKSSFPSLEVKAERKKIGTDLEKQEVNVSDLKEDTLPAILKELIQKKQINTIQKVYRNSTNPSQELENLKSKFSQEIAEGKRNIREPEFLNIDFSKVYKLVFEGSTSPILVSQKLSQDPDVEYSEPNYIYRAHLIPNDAEFSKQWHLNNVGQSSGKANADIDAPEAWDIFTGKDNIIVGIIDTGIDHTHSDLTANMWTNLPESEGQPDFDDDGNGYIDDIHGWNFFSNTNQTMDDQGHGTHVAGIVGATGNNNLGVVGATWQSRLMALKFLDASGLGSSIGASRALDYATTMGARITNNSWGGLPFSQTLYDAIKRAHAADALYIASAGNGGRDSLGDDIDKYPIYPASYNVPNIIAVGATDKNDNLTSFSNYGTTSVDIVAPGKDILSTGLHDWYLEMSGTSMSSPLVAGVASLVLGKNPTISNLEIKEIIEYGADKIELQKPNKSGRLNASGSLRIATIPPTSEIISPEPYTSLDEFTEIVGIAAGRSFSSYIIEMGEGYNPTTWTTKGVTLQNGGKLPVDDSILATINSTGYQPGIWTLKLSVSGIKGVNTLEKMVINIDKPRSLGQAVGIPKGNNYILVPAETQNSSLNFEQPLTIEVWFRAEGNYASILSNKVERGDGNTSLPLYDLYKDQSFISFWHSFGSIGKHSVYLKTLSTDSWHHLALTTDGQNPKIFLNGVRLVSNISTRDINSVINKYLSLEIGKGGSGKLVDELRISKTVRDVETNWKNGIYHKQLEPDSYTVGLWHFEKNLLDASNFRNHGIQNGVLIYMGPTLTPSPTPPNFLPKIINIFVAPPAIAGKTSMFVVQATNKDMVDRLSGDVSIINPKGERKSYSLSGGVRSNNVWELTNAISIVYPGKHTYTVAVKDSKNQLVTASSYFMAVTPTKTPTKTPTQIPTKLPTPKMQKPKVTTKVPPPNSR